MHRGIVALWMMAGAGMALLPAPATASGAAWEPWTAVSGVFDLGGPRRSDGSIVVGGAAALYLMTPDGAVSPFAPRYHDDVGGEPYIAVSPGLAGQSCGFLKDETYVLRLHAPLGVTRISGFGDEVTQFAQVQGVTTLGGIAFDTTGGFGHRLLVTGSSAGKTQVSAIDCRGGVQVITKSAPVVEGGMAVAPSGFGTFGGDLIAPDELSGVVWAIDPAGTAHPMINPGLPKGGDIGVESVGFVPPGFLRTGGAVYYADRATPGNPHPGTDHVLRLASVVLIDAGVRDGDLLAATEGGASLVAVRCDTDCHVIPVLTAPTTAHGEGHLGFAAASTLPPPSPTPVPRLGTDQVAGAGPAVGTLTRFAVLVLLLALGGWLLWRRRRHA